MQAFKIFKSVFSLEGLSSIYFTFIAHKKVVGIDKTSNQGFQKRLSENLELIYRKVNEDSYTFSFYKAKLIIKGRNKYPRVISIPTIRDQLTLKAINILLSIVYQDEIKYKQVQTLLSNIKEKMLLFDSFIKIDISEFYPSINHDILLTKVKRKIRKKEILSLVSKAIRKKTLITRSEELPSTRVGIPQGLSISNILANIYMMDFDKVMKCNSRFSYHRYVDDILILCKSIDKRFILNDIKKELSKLNLEVNKDKIENGSLTQSFNYLGYYNTGSGFSVRPSSVSKLRDSIVKSFTYYNYSEDLPLNYLIWRVNLRITGCIMDKNKYGWMFFYSQIDDLKLLFQLDHFVDKLIKRFLRASDQFNPKKFVRTFWEIKSNLSSTKYIPNFTEYSFTAKVEVLNGVFLYKNVNTWPEKKVNEVFNILIFQSIKDLEKDFQRMS